MQTLFPLIILAVWLVGTWIRIYKQARYYQIEEYMSLRYLRWYFQKRDRWLPGRSTIIWFIGIALSLLLSEAPGVILPGILLILSAVIAIIPADEGEIKRKFVRTQRATRLLSTAFVLATILAIIVFWIVNTIELPDVEIIELVLVSAIGFAIFLIAPFNLIAGNALMQPVEGFLRQRFIQQAKTVMDTVQPIVIGVTGSYGKTTTKNFLRDILNGRYKTYATPKSYNTMMGVCLAINNDLANDYSVEYFISEMGAYVPGEIARICELTPPHIGVMIEVGPQHLERFGSLENTARAKYELIEQLPPEGLGVFNWDNSFIREMIERGYPANRIAVSMNVSLEEARQYGIRFIASNINESPGGLQFDVTDTEINVTEQFQTAIVGEHNVTNILLATAVAVHEGMSLREVKLRVRTMQPPESRLVPQSTPGGITIINDSYSANPVGVVSALKVLGMHQTGKRLLITPGMVELGELQDIENRRLGELATQYASHIILVGSQQTKPLQEGIQSTSFPKANWQVVETLSDAVEWYKQNLVTGDTVLFLNDLPDTY